MQLESIAIDDLKPYSKNARRHSTKQIDLLAKNIQEFGFTTPILIDKDNEIVAGHGRLEALKKLKWQSAFCVRMDNLNKEQIKALRLADNQIASMADWDMELVVEELKDLTKDIVELTGFDVDLIIEPDEKDDEVPDVPDEPKSKLGDIYQLGNHRIMCGDSTKIEDVEKLMDGKKADMVFTDPPYGISVVKPDGMIGGNRVGVGKVRYPGLVNTKVYRPVIGDDEDFDPTFLLDQAAHLIIWGANNFAALLPNYSHWLVWDKKGEMQLKNDFSDCELAWTNFPKKTVKKYIHMWAGMTRKGSRKEELKERVHPTQKPVGLFVDILQDYSNEKWIILDLYLGSGSTLIACEKTNRVCYGMEIDPKYIDVIIQRYIDYTGKNAVRLNDGKMYSEV